MTNNFNNIFRTSIEEIKNSIMEKLNGKDIRFFFFDTDGPIFNKNIASQIKKALNLDYNIWEGA